MKITMQHNNNKEHFVFNATFEAFYSFSQFKFISNLALPSSSDDKRFQLEFNKASVDLCLLSKGIKTNMMYQKLIDMFFASATQGLLTCPTGIVSCHFVWSYLDDVNTLLMPSCCSISQSLEKIKESSFFLRDPRTLSIVTCRASNYRCLFRSPSTR